MAYLPEAELIEKPQVPFNRPTVSEATWGPSYDVDFGLTELETHHDDLNLRLTPATLTGKRWGPSYRQ